MGESSLLKQAAFEQILEQRVSPKLVYTSLYNHPDVGFLFIFFT
jgi:hypothetical protein